MGAVFHGVYEDFDKKRFQNLSSKLNELELKGRVLLITEALRKELPRDFVLSMRILKKVLSEKKLKSFELGPISEYISQFGVDHFDEILNKRVQ